MISVTTRPAGTGQWGVGLLGAVGRGALAGAAGTTVLNAVTYLDMATRARPASSTPEETVKKLSDAAGVQIPGEGEQQQNRISGLAPLMGIATGVGVGVLAGLARWRGWRAPGALDGLVIGALVMAASDLPMTGLGITDPRTWKAADWASDAIPHAAYGWATSAVLSRLRGLC